MSHTIHVLVSSSDEAYILVLNKKKSLETLINEAMHSNAHYEKKNAQRVRFIREHVKGLSIEHYEVSSELNTMKEILEYRDSIIAKYASDGFIIVDEKHYELLDSSADKNFDKILKMIDINHMINVWGKDALIQGRKNLTVGEFLSHFGAVCS